MQGHAGWPDPRTFPVGYDCEVFTSEALLAADAMATAPYDREHVTSFIVTHPDCRQANIVSVDPLRRHIRWTLDDVDDYAIIYKEFQRRIAEGRA